MTVNKINAAARAPLEPLLTVGDLERILGVHRRTIRRLCKRGQLPPPLRLGGGIRWRPEAVAAALEALESGHKCGARVAGE